MYRSAAIAFLLMLSWPGLMTLADTECSGLDCTEAAGGAQKAGEVDVTMAQPDALAQCWAESTNRTEVGPCLAAKQEVADAVLAVVMSDMENQARRLDEITSANNDVRGSFLRAEEAFRQYREANCRRHQAMLTSGTGAGNAYQACTVDLTRARTAELRKALGK